jgi:hypothetical protein
MNQIQINFFFGQYEDLDSNTNVSIAAPWKD